MRTGSPILHSLAACLVGLGLFASGAVLRSVLHSNRVEANWQRTAGVLLDVEIEEQIHWRALGRQQRSREVSVFYAYHFDGREYEGTELSAFSPPGFDWTPWRVREAEALPEPPEAITVWVDPDRPDNSVLTPGLDPYAASGLLGMCLSWTAVGGALWLAIRRGACGKRSVRVFVAGFILSLIAFASRLWWVGGGAQVLLGTLSVLGLGLILLARHRRRVVPSPRVDPA